MEEAGDRVDSNMDELKQEYTEKLRKMEILLKKVRCLAVLSSVLK